MVSRTRGWALAVSLGVAGLAVGCRSPGELTSAQPTFAAAAGLPTAAAPADNPQTPDKIALGRALFFDARLSLDGTVACGSCHDPARAFTDGRPASVGVRGRLGQRNAPTVLNALYNKTLFWDGRTTTLEEQAVLPILNPSEMGQPDLDSAVGAIARDRKYQQAFQKVFGRPPNGADLVRAIASYERSEVAFASPFDAFVAGDPNAVSDQAKRGWAMFRGKAHCNQCHALSEARPDTTFFMDHRFHNIGIGIDRHNVVALACTAQARLNSGNLLAVDQAAIQSELSALGSFLVTKQSADIASFRTPSLRNVLVTAPYFHDGSARTLWDVVDHYNKGGMNNPWLDTNIRPLALSETEIDDIVAFLASLTSTQFREQGARELARQGGIARAARPERETARAFGPRPARLDPALACIPRT